MPGTVIHWRDFVKSPNGYRCDAPLIIVRDGELFRLHESETADVDVTAREIRSQRTWLLDRLRHGLRLRFGYYGTGSLVLARVGGGTRTTPNQWRLVRISSLETCLNTRLGELYWVRPDPRAVQPVGDAPCLTATSLYRITEHPARLTIEEALAGIDLTPPSEEEE